MKLNPCDSSPCAEEEICSPEINSPLGYTCQGSQNTQDYYVLSKIFILREENQKKMLGSRQTSLTQIRSVTIFLSHMKYHKSFEESLHGIVGSWQSLGSLFFFPDSTKNHQKG